MNDNFGIRASINIIFYLVISFGFFTGIILMVSREAFDTLNKAVRKEYGLKTKILPKLEGETFDAVDKFVLKNSKLLGLIVTIACFLLLLFYK